jgi:hypothetical protein
VIDLEFEKVYNRKQNIEELNEIFLKENSLKLESLIEGAKVLYLLDPISNQKRSISLATNLDDNLVAGRTLKVIFILSFNFRFINFSLLRHVLVFIIYLKVIILVN